jgi:hypothetical protein
MAGFAKRAAIELPHRDGEALAPVHTIIVASTNPLHLNPGLTTASLFRPKKSCRVHNEKLEEERKSPPPSPGQNPALVTNLTSSQGSEHPTVPPYPNTLQ